MSFTIDMHCDSLMAALFREGPTADVFDCPEQALDIKRLPEGKAMAQFFAIFIPPEEAFQHMKYPVSAPQYIEECAQVFENTISRHSDVVAKACNAEDVERNWKGGKLSAILTMEDGVEDFFIYCNSLAGAFDFDVYAEEKGVNIYTPLQIYRSIGRKYSRVGVIAAHNMSAYRIEEALLSANPDMYVIGSGNMAIVSAIEHGLEPEDIIEKCGIRHMVSYMEACGCEALILGCTHFPYLKRELEKFCSIPVIDPADEMFAAMTGLK